MNADFLTWVSEGEKYALVGISVKTEGHIPSGKISLNLWTLTDPTFAMPSTEKNGQTLSGQALRINTKETTDYIRGARSGGRGGWGSTIPWDRCLAETARYARGFTSDILRLQHRSRSVAMASFPLVSATGMLGSGFRAESLDKAISLGARMIGCDAGSTDPGPGPLATGICMFSAAAVKRDTEIMMTRARKAGIPLIIGSAGTSGSDAGLAWMVDIVHEIAREQDLHFKLAVIHSELSPEVVRRHLRDGHARALPPSAPLSDADIDAATHIVGMMGVEPIQQALRAAHKSSLPDAAAILQSSPRCRCSKAMPRPSSGTWPKFSNAALRRLPCVPRPTA